MISGNQQLEIPDSKRVQTALLSVYDKTGLVPLARALHELDVGLISTGGTARKLKEAGLPVTEVKDVTGYPELLGGRVKSLHPAIQAGVLARRTLPADAEDLKREEIQPIDLVVGNLYPFEKALAEEADPLTLMENVDIGGPTLLRAAAKNHAFVAVLSAPEQYDRVLDEMKGNSGQLSFDTRRSLAAAAFQKTAQYDQAICAHFMAQSRGAKRSAEQWPDPISVHVPRFSTLRYGENPHQGAALYGSPDRFFEQLHGKPLSYNNMLDVSAALMLIDEFRDESPTCAILKHTNPCGVGTADRLESAYQRAFSTDRRSPFGGIVVVNRPLDQGTAEEIDRIFTEVVIAPDFEEGVLNMLMQKKNRRLIKSRQPARTDASRDIRTVLGGLLVQERDPVTLPLRAEQREWEIPTKRKPTDDEMQNLIFAWRVVKHVKSNAIVYAKHRTTLGIGAGQMSRIDASELAVAKGRNAELDFSGSVVASDAFFPFADGLEAAVQSGARAAIQPGGSIRDEEVIRAADARDVAMVFTGSRHFRH